MYRKRNAMPFVIGVILSTLCLLSGTVRADTGVDAALKRIIEDFNGTYGGLTFMWSDHTQLRLVAAVVNEAQRDGKITPDEGRAIEELQIAFQATDAGNVLGEALQAWSGRHCDSALGMTCAGKDTYKIKKRYAVESTRIYQLHEAYEEGLRKYREGRYAEALKLFRNAYRIAPDFVNAYYFSGLSHIELGQADQGIRELSTVIKLQPDNADAYLSVARIYYKRGDCEAAVPYYDRALQIQPDSGPLVERGYCNARLGKYQQAVEDLSSYIEHDGSDPAAYQNRAAAYEKLGEKEKARKDRETYERIKGAGR